VLASAPHLVVLIKSGNVPYLTPAASPRELRREQAARYLTELAECLSPRWEVPISVAVMDGLAADELSTHATAIGADLVVMTTHGYGSLSRMWVGSVADTLLRRLPMPILLTRPHDEALDLLEEVHDQAFEHVLIPLDGSALAEEILEPALALGAAMGARYTLLQAIQVPVLGYACLLKAMKTSFRSGSVSFRQRAPSQRMIQSETQTQRRTVCDACIYLCSH